MESHNPKISTLFGLLAIFGSLAYAENCCKFPAIFNFGDSNSDTGGISAAFGSPAPFPNGVTHFHTPSGRFSDGRLVIDFIGTLPTLISSDLSLLIFLFVFFPITLFFSEYIFISLVSSILILYSYLMNCITNFFDVVFLKAESLGLPYLNAYLDSVGSNFSHGVNFATAGSTIRPQNTTMKQSGYSPISLDVQLLQFKDFCIRSKNIRKQGQPFYFLSCCLLPLSKFNFFFFFFVTNKLCSKIFTYLHHHKFLENGQRRKVV